MFGQANVQGVKDELDRLDGSNKYLKIKVGTTRVRILPPHAQGNGVWYRPTATHYGFVVGGEFKKYTCPRTAGRVSCPICDAASRYYQAGDPESRKMYSKIKAKHEFYYMAYNVDQPNEIKMMKAPKTLHQQIQRVVLNYGNITDPKEGYDLFITATQKSSNNSTFLEYSVLPNKAPTGIHQSILSIAESMDNLSTKFTTAADDAELLAALKCVDTQDRFADAQRHQVVAPGQPLPAQPTGTPVCLKNGAFNETDVDCQGCAFKAQCQENKAKIAANFKAIAVPAGTVAMPAMPAMPATPAMPTLGNPGTVSSSAVDDLARRLAGK